MSATNKKSQPPGGFFDGVLVTMSHEELERLRALVPLGEWPGWCRRVLLEAAEREQVVKTDGNYSEMG